MTLSKRLVGRAIKDVDLRRPEVVRGRRRRSNLLQGEQIKKLIRLGKQLALIPTAPEGIDPCCVCVHLGMSGSLCLISSCQAPDQLSDSHAHVIWHLSGGDLLIFRDPRRFGGVWTFPTTSALQELRWQRLGTDALTITPMALQQRLNSSSRSIKAVLLDQNMIAGLGNIYVDELLFASGISPLQPANSFSPELTQQLVRQMRRLLTKAIREGGSTLRDYRDGNGSPGQFQNQLCVYGKAGQSCGRCATWLSCIKVVGRTTVFCPKCQKLPRTHKRS